MRLVALLPVLALSIAAAAQPTRWVQAPTAPASEWGAHDLVSTGTHLFALTGGALYRSADGLDWQAVEQPGGPQRLFQIWSGPNGTLAGVGDEGAGDDRLYVSPDGETWQPLASFGVSSCWRPPIGTAFLATSTGRLLAGLSCDTGMPIYSEVLASGDGGASWSVTLPISHIAGTTRLVEGDGSVFALFSRASPEGGVHRLLRSDDDGTSWSEVALPGYPIDVAAAGSAVALLAATATERVLWRSSDAGDTWSSTALTFDGARARIVGTDGGNLMMAPAGPYRLGGVPASGVPFSRDGGLTWTALDDGIGPHPVTHVAVAPDGRLVALTYDATARVVHAYVTEGAVVAGEAPATATTLALDAAPSPTHDRVRLVFTLPEPADITLAAYDALGRRVAALAKGARGAGEHSASWEVGRLAPGVYVVVLRAGEAVARTRVVVAR